MTCPGVVRRQRRLVVAFLPLIALIAGCHGLFQLGPRPSQLVGVWVDSSHTTPTDTIIRIFSAGGTDRSLRIRVKRESTGHATIDRDETMNGTWHLSGDLADSTKRRLCVTRRPGRNPATCVPSHLDTLLANAERAPRHRLIVWDSADKQRAHGHVLLGRLP